MDQARWLIVVAVVFCMLGALTLLHRWSRQDGPISVPSGAKVGKQQELETVRRPAGEPPPQPSASYLSNDAAFSFGEVPTHCQGTDDKSAVAESHQALNRFGADQ